MTKRKCLCLLVDEMQVIVKSTKLLTEAKLFFESLANIRIPYIGVGTFQLSELSWSTEEARISSPFNRQVPVCN